MVITRKQRRFLFILLLAGISLSFFFSTRQYPAVSLKTEERIQFGMAEEEVLMIIGAPPGDYRTRTVLYGGLQRSPTFLDEYRWDFRDPSSVVARKPLTMKVWTTDNGKMEIWFDKNGHVAGKVFNDPAVSVGWLRDKYESVLQYLGLRQPRCWCLG